MCAVLPLPTCADDDGSIVDQPHITVFRLEDHHMRATILAVAAFMLIPLGTVASQAVQPKSGDRIRITATPYALEHRTARVVSVRNDSLILDVAPAETLAVALAGVTQLDVSTGRRRNTLRGAGIGALIGVGSGALIGFASGDDPPTAFFSLSASEKAALAGATLGVTGLVIGAVVGTLIVSDRWTSVPLGVAKATPSLQVGHGNTRLALAVSFQPGRQRPHE